MRLFIGIPLPAEYVTIIRELQGVWRRRLASKISWVRPELVHLTLMFLGEVGETSIPAIKAAMSEAVGESFSMRAGTGGCFPSQGHPRVVWVGLRQGGDECCAYYKALEGALKRAGFASEAKPFIPHLSVARIKKAAGGDDWPGLIADLGRSWPEFRVDSIVLWRSALRVSGPEYTRIAEIPIETGYPPGRGACPA